MRATDEPTVFAIGGASGPWATHLRSILGPAALVGLSVDLAELAARSSQVDVCLIHADGADVLVTVAHVWQTAPHVSVIVSGDHVDDDTRRAAFQSGVAFVTGAAPSRDELRAVLRMARDQNRSGSPELVRAMCRAMCNISRLASSACDRSFLDAAVDQIAELFQASRVSVQLVDAEGSLRIAAQRGLGDVGAASVGRSAISYGVLRSGEPRIILRSAHTRGSGDCDDRGAISASMCVPLAPVGAGDHVRGVVSIARTSDRSIFTPRDLEVASSIARLLSETLTSVEARMVAAETERRLTAAERLTTLGEIAAGIAHEVANPLAVARANVGALIEYLNEAAPLLAELEESHPELTEMLDDLPAVVCETWEGLFRADEVIRQVKGMARADDETSREEPLSLAEIVTTAIRFLGVRLPKVRTELDPSALVQGSGVELSQILVNLLVNAADACEERRTIADDPGYAPMISIALVKNADRVLLTVEDNGCGMSEDTKERAFMPLFTTKPGARGTGLGLSLVRRIVDRHAGSIRVASVAGTGTSFSISLPAAPAPRSTSLDLVNEAAQVQIKEQSETTTHAHERAVQ